MKRFISIMLMLIMVLSMGIVTVSADSVVDYKEIDYIKSDMLYVHGTSQMAETQAWQHWQKLDLYRDYDEDEQSAMGVKREDGISEEYYFFLPSGADGKKAEILNTFSEDIKIGDILEAFIMEEIAR